jgi:N-acetylglucosamine-6-phosphate deacetylase
MDRALANLQAFTGAPLSTAIRLASHNPAMLLGLDATLSPGQPANFNIFNTTGQLQSTLLRGVATSPVAMEAAVS